MNRVRLFLLILAVTLVGGAALACGDDGEDAAERLVERAIEESGGGDVDIEVGNVKVPDDFPKEFPVYEGAKVTFTLSGSGRGGQGGAGWTVSWETRDSLDKVINFYKDNLSKNQWNVSVSSTDADGGTFFIDRTIGGKSIGGIVTVTREGSNTAITAILGEDSN